MVLASATLPFPSELFQLFDTMTNNKKQDVIIIGGSYAGLSAAMVLGRGLRNVVIIDSGFPCNRSTPHSHNLITLDGLEPAEIARRAREQVLKYETVKFHQGLAVSAVKTSEGFQIMTQSGESFTSKKLIFATGVRDLMPSIDGFADCWGKTVIHCPYCHGYEVRKEKTGILANGDVAMHYAQLIRNWTNDLTVFTNGKSTLTKEQSDRLEKHGIGLIEKEVSALVHQDGILSQIRFKDQSAFDLKAIYARPDFEQHCNLPEQLGCELTEQGYIKVDMFQKTTIPGVFACGDSTSPMRSVANAIATGNFAGALTNNLMTEEEFLS